MKTLFQPFRSASTTALVLAMMVCVVAAAAVNVLNGSVTNAGLPVAGAKVVVDSSSDATYEATTFTDVDGRFTFANAPAGEIHVNVYDDQGVFLATGTMMLREGETAAIALEIEP